nr:hypothetical protein Itr_chr11CG08760 [Ipomoea trifida]
MVTTPPPEAVKCWLFLHGYSEEAEAIPWLKNSIPAGSPEIRNSSPALAASRRCKDDDSDNDRPCPSPATALAGPPFPHAN